MVFRNEDLNGSAQPESARLRDDLTAHRILVVEDNESISRLIQIVLESAGYTVHTVGDAERALEMVAVVAPEIILMDIQLPGMDGFELTQRLKADPATADIVIVAVTAYAMKGDHVKALEAGCDGHVAKPIDVRTLPATVSSYLTAASVGNAQGG